MVDMDSDHEKTFTYRPLGLDKGENKIKKMKAHIKFGL
jgi:hypothetical protein